MIGVISLTEHVEVYEFSSLKVVKSLILNGNDVMTSKSIAKGLNLQHTNSPFPNNPYFIKVKGNGFEDCNDTSDSDHLGSLPKNLEHLNDLIDSLVPLGSNFQRRNRPKRAISLALEVGLVLSQSFDGYGLRICSFIGGPSTVGSGSITGLDKSQILRAQYNIEKNDELAHNFQKSEGYYRQLTEDFIKGKVTCDIFGFSLDQFGIAEMKSMVNKTGGICMIQEEFKQQVFRDTFERVYVNAEGKMRVASGAKVQVLCSSPFKLKGAIGPVCSKKKFTRMVSNNEIGEGKTNLWYVGGLDPSLTITFFFEIDEKEAQSSDVKEVFFQFITTFKDSSTGLVTKRVTSIRKPMIDPPAITQFLEGIDEEACLATFGKLAGMKSSGIESASVLRWLDRQLIMIFQTFSLFTPGDADSFEIPDSISNFPQFFYLLRKSSFVAKFNCSMDEGAYFRLCMERENVNHCLLMVQPSAERYHMEEEEPVSVLCDYTSLRDNVILVVDTYFYLIIWQGQTIVTWIENKFHEDPHYAHFAEFIKIPEEDVKILVQSNDRIISPRIIRSKPNDGNSRYLKARFTYSEETAEDQNLKTDYISDDKTLKVFIKHLILAVTGEL